MRKMFKLIGVLLIAVFVISIMPFVRPNTLDASQEEQIKQILNQKSVNNERVSFIADHFDAFALRMAMIESAQESIAITSYIAHPGESTDMLFSALYDAAQRGVKVSMVFDSKLGGMSGKLAKSLASHPNISIYHYNPFRLLKPYQLQAVFHEKYFLVDEHMLVLGGRNIGDKYFDPPNFTSSVSYDYDIFAYQEESTIFFESIKDHHEGLINNKNVEKLEGGAQPYAVLQDYPSYNLEPFIEKTVKVDSIQFVSDPLTPQDSTPFIASLLQRLALKSEKEILVQTPYMTHHPKLFATLAHKKEDVDIAILTNSISSSWNFPAFGAYYNFKKPFITSADGLYEYQSDGGKDSIHGKAYLIDDTLVLGSLNLDHRSYYINPETVVLVEGEAVAKMFKDEYMHKLEKAYAIKQGHLEAGCKSPARAPLFKRVQMRIVGFVAYLFKILI